MVLHLLSLMSPWLIVKNGVSLSLFWRYYFRIVHKGLSNLLPLSKSSTPPITRIPPFLKIPQFPHLNGKSAISTVKLSSMNTIHVKQQHNVGFIIFKFTLKYMLGNVYINKIHARQCLYIISLYCREGLPHPFNFFVVSKGIHHA